MIRHDQILVRPILCANASSPEGLAVNFPIMTNEAQAKSGFRIDEPMTTHIKSELFSLATNSVDEDSVKKINVLIQSWVLSRTSSYHQQHHGSQNQ